MAHSSPQAAIKKPTPAWTEMRPHAVQQRLWTTKARFAAVVAGRVSGKTELARRRLVTYLRVRKPWSTPRYFYGAPTYKQAKRIGWDKLLELIPKWWIASISYGELKITTIWGTELWVFGLDEPARVEGTEWDGCVLDESSDLVPKTFDVSVYPALVSRRGWCWRIGVPKRFGPSVTEYREFYERCARGDYEDGEAFTWPSADIQPADVIEHARRNLDPLDYREQFEAQFETIGGLIFQSFDREWNVRPCTYRREKPMVIGCDFNVNPMCWLLGHQYKDHFEVFDEIFRRDTNTVDTLEYLIGRYPDHEGGFAFFGDATGKARKTAAVSTDYLQILNHKGFKKAGRTVHFPDSNPTNVNAYSCLNALLCNAAKERRLFVDDRCERLIRDFRLRAYKPGTREAADKSGKATDTGHMSDALCYVIYKLYPPVLERSGVDQIATRGW